MSEETKIGTLPVQSRRAFVKTATQVAVTAPAAAMLLSASVTPAKAMHYGDDFVTFGDDRSPDNPEDAILGDDFVP